MKNGIITLGEALIDFIPLDKSNINYQKSPGGAPANVAVGLARLGTPASFIGKVGMDSLGGFLKATLTKYNVNTSSMSLSSQAKTGFAFITHDDRGDRSFEFFNQPSADSYLTENDLHSPLFKTNKVLHIGSISLIREPIKKTIWQAIHLAKENEMLLSYDPNLRLDLWDNPELAKTEISTILPYTDILKISEEELYFLSGKENEVGISYLAQKYNIPFIFVTKGSKGCLAYCKKGFIEVAALGVETIDTTGAGDAFVSAVLYQVNQLNKLLTDVTITELQKIVHFANVSGGVTTTRNGAMTALPTLEEIDFYLK